MKPSFLEILFWMVLCTGLLTGFSWSMNALPKVSNKPYLLECREEVVYYKDTDSPVINRQGQIATCKTREVL